MGCVLRAGGKEFDVDAFIGGTTLLPCAVFRKGELTGSKNLKRSGSGLNIEISKASFDNFEKQIKDAVKFLEENKREITKLIKAEGLDGPPELDFAVNKSDAFTLSYCFPADLVALAGRMGLGIRVSQYPIEDK